LQETKMEDARFPMLEIAAAGYQAIFSGQRTYNGVAILSRAAASDARPDMPEFPDDHRRVLAATFGDVRCVCFYVPNGQSVGSEKYEYKLRWLAAATIYPSPRARALPAARGDRRHEHRARGSRRARSESMARPAAVQRCRARSFPRLALAPPP